MFTNFDWIGAMRSSPVMIAILLCSVIAVGFALERFLYFWKRRGDAAAFYRQVSEKVRSGHLKEALWVCTATPHPVGEVAAAVIKNAHLAPESIEEKLQIALGEQRMQLERNLGVLGTLGNTAPLIGLLGTVWGIMRAFHDMAATGSAGPSVVAAGVAEALFTTASGLLVAVPAVIVFNHFSRRTTVLLTQAEHKARALRLDLEESRSSSRTSQAA